MRSRFIGLAALAAITPSCGPARMPHEGEGVRFELTPDQIGGINLVVRNGTSASLCIPPATLAAVSGGVSANQAGKEFRSTYNSEYGPDAPGSGPYYIASRNAVATVPIDFTGLDLKEGVYTFHVDVAWTLCDRLSSNQPYPTVDFKRTLVKSKAFYRPFK